MHVLSRGMEHWHPNPDFFFQPGGGPILDLGPYYITDLISLVGPIKRVTAFTGSARAEREVTTEGSPFKGMFIKVGTPTTIHAILEFHSGAIITLGASWDVSSHGHHNIELYGTEGSVYVPDPNFFNGDVTITNRAGDKEKVTPWDHPFGKANQDLDKPNPRANYRNAGSERHDGLDRDRQEGALRSRRGAACRRRHDLDPARRRDRPGDHAPDHLRAPRRPRHRRGPRLLR
jgi:predicted dehydrogenase